MEVGPLSPANDKPIQHCSIHHSQSQMPMLMAMTIIVDSLLPRPKLDCDVGYDVAMKGPSVVVHVRPRLHLCGFGLGLVRVGGPFP